MNRTRVFAALFALLFTAVFCGSASAALFSSSDNAFTVDLPSAWQKVTQDGTVLSLKRDGATMKIMQVKDCNNSDCLLKEINKELDSIKSKKFKILENTYTGDVIKKTEFSTGDPLYSFNFSAASVDFTTAYFLADGKAYNVGIKGLPYVEADLVLSFISPAAKQTDASAGAEHTIDFNDPQIADISLDAPPAELTAKNAAPVDIVVGEAQPAAKKAKAPARKGGGEHKINLIFLLASAYAAILMLSFVVRMFMRVKTEDSNSNPRSYYPVKGSRLYGSPDLFFAMRDNQGNNYIANSGRWGNVLMGLGIFVTVLFALTKSFILLLKAQGILKLSAILINTLVSLSSLLSVFGFIIFMAGLLINLLFAYKFFIYDKAGKTAYKCLQKGFHLFREEYVVADEKSAVLFRIKRDRFKLLRTWVVYNSQGTIAVIKEQGKIKAALRLVLGHLCGFLRASYTLEGRLESRGSVKSAPRLFSHLKAEIDKPQAIDARITLITCAVIFMRDRDKWHPWVN